MATGPLEDAMRIPRKYIDQSLAPDSVARPEEPGAHYLARVLRLRPGDPVVLFNGDGYDYAGEVLDPRCREIGIHARVPAAAESPLELVLVQAVGKGDRMDTALQKASELGVFAVQPLFTERTNVRLDGKRLLKRLAHWRGVVVAACEQSGRARVPEVREPCSLADYLAHGASGGRDHVRLALLPGAEQSLASLGMPASADIIVGPEGGFSDPEVKALSLAGALPVSLGPRVLRTETAGPAAIAVLQALGRDWR